MKFLLRLAVFAAIIPLLSACGGGSSSDDQHSISKEEIEVDDNAKIDLIVIADQALTTVVDGSTIEVTLTNVHDELAAFTEPPERKSFYVPTNQLGLWDQMFPSAPNAVLFGRETDSETDMASVMQMSKPVYDEEAKTITFTATVLGDSPFPPETIQDAALLIDPTIWEWIKIGWNCGKAIISIVVAALQDEADPLADIKEVTNSISCINAIASVHDW